MLNWVLSFLSFCLLLGGSFPNQTSPHVVTEISVQWMQDGTENHRVYIQPGKMNKLLLYLRSLDPVPKNEAPDPQAVPEYQITLQLSDGTVVRYTQLGITNFRKEDGSWQVIDPEDAIRLPLILAAVPGDS